ncbi:probable ubiquitin-conjugating enzyme E2 23 isoform X1 [Amborella trichopoda]|uniref:probable ubiquitin-conjugating enzyme E2 23 isoform X1 n=1 Tax=Amborella trichopoda TaxID=13333 RepID=UPI0009C13F3A|nr:probable ubiquitin-conjugating enzyme E2 23 isoform X1 [Amborella trichopoda]|eukprot:XP_020517139.1 probable ubiquitin-conjugating enzyme E2 23 isoform X1 [Amborella trichopoda]
MGAIEHHINDSSFPHSTGSSETDANVARMGSLHNESLLSHDFVSAPASAGNSENGETGNSVGFLGNKSRDLYVYRQDVVKSDRYKGLVGMVTKVAGDSDSDSSISDDDDDADDDDDDDEEGSCSSLTDGQVRVVWVNHSETKDNIDDIVVVDRGFLHGDIVASISDPMGQTGTVVDVDIKVDLCASSGEIVKNVSTRDLLRVREFAVDDYVLHGPWLGRIDEVVDNVTVMFDDGSICKVMRADPLRLMPISKNLLEDGHFPYYPGQRVRACSSSVFKNSRWFSGFWKATRLEGTVTKVQVASVFVNWIAAANAGGYGSDIPPEEQDPKDLKLLTCFSHANWQLGDWCLLRTPAPAVDADASTEDPVSCCGDPNECLVKPFEDVDSASCDTKLQECIGSSSEDQHASNGLGLEEAMLKNTNGVAFNCVDLGETPLHSEENGHSQMDPSDAVLLERKSTLDVNSTSIRDSNGFPESSICNSSLHISKEPVHEGSHSQRKRLRKRIAKRDRRTRRRDETFERSLLIVKTVTRVDVAWQDGAREFGIDSRNLIPIDNPGDHEFFAEQYVVEKATDEDEGFCESRRVGVVKSVNATERTACVRWLKPVTRPEDPREFDNEEVVSVYELSQHPDYDYCFGDIVIRLSPVSVTPEMAPSGNTIEKEMISADDATLPESDERIGYNLEETNDEVKTNKDKNYKFDESDLSWIGNITGLKDGDIEVTWADGMVSKVGPQAVFVVGRDEDEGSIQADLEDGDDDAASWETVDSDEMSVENADEETQVGDMPKGHSDDDSGTVRRDTLHQEQNVSEQNGGLSIPLAALGFVTRLASGILFRGRKHVETFGSNSSEGMAKPGLRDILDGSSNDDVITSEESNNAIANHGASTMPPNSANTILEAAANSLGSPYFEEASSMGDPGRFKHFDSVKDSVDHYFIGETGWNNNDRKWVKKIQQDWNILQKNLPADAIYVRVYEDRMDLLRAVIVGAHGTPYQDGLFFFDFHLPPDYPQVPPSAYYYSSGLRLNPNLYENGKVCLSLLNTWTGKGNEVWDPSSSSILQVLVSLQGLVLNSKPYFNEAGYDKQVGTAEGEKNSVSYNENTFLLNCKMMLYLLRRRPKHFEEFIKDHFWTHGHFILGACDAHLKGAIVGSLTEDGIVCEQSGENGSSVGFKLMLGKIVPRLISAFSEVGVDCSHFSHLVS